MKSLLLHAVFIWQGSFLAQVLRSVGLRLLYKLPYGIQKATTVLTAYGCLQRNFIQTPWSLGITKNIGTSICTHRAPLRNTVSGLWYHDGAFVAPSVLILAGLFYFLSFYFISFCFYFTLCRHEGFEFLSKLDILSCSYPIYYCDGNVKLPHRYISFLA